MAKFVDQGTWEGLGVLVSGLVAGLLGKVGWDKHKRNGHVSTADFREFKVETRERFDSMDGKMDGIAEDVAFLRGKLDK